jgi:hypothetical protein
LADEIKEILEGNPDPGLLAMFLSLDKSKGDLNGILG